jgi:hypothetical protein
MPARENPLSALPKVRHNSLSKGTVGPGNENV